MSAGGGADSNRGPHQGAWTVTALLIAGLVVIGLVVGLRDGFNDALAPAAILALTIASLLVAPIANRNKRVIALEKEYAWSLKTAVWLLPLLLFALTILIVGEEAGSRAFHSAAAQLLPVLALALVLEAGAFREQLAGDDPTLRATALVTLALLVYGEYEALDSLAARLGRDAEIVWGAAAAGVSGLVLVAVLGTATQSSSR